MTQEAAATPLGPEFWDIAGRRLEIRRIPSGTHSRPPIVMLHEGLGSASHWRNFPDRVAAATLCEVLVYSRYGHGRSSPLEEPREVSYMHHEAEVVLPAVMEKALIRKPVLFGHSDGATIAILYAAKFPDAIAGLVLEAPHVFVEDLAVESIARAKVAFQKTDLAARLSRHHLDAERTFRGWNDIWLDPRFRAWNIESSLDSVLCPVMVIQGENDEYGTARQIQAIRAKIPSVQVALLPECRHAPHRDQPEVTLALVTTFLSRL